MKKYLALAAAVCIVITTAASPAAADGLKFPRLFPFSKKEQDKPRSRTTQASHSEPVREQNSGGGFPTLPKPQLPKLSMPTIEMPKLGGGTTGSSSPSTWQKMSRGTKSFFTKTKTTLMPWTKKETSTVQTPRLGARPAPSRKPKPEKNNLLPWLDAQPEEKEIKSVNDFLALPQPQY